MGEKNISGIQVKSQSIEIIEAGVSISGDLYSRSNLTRLQVLYWIGQSMRRESPVFNTIYTYTIKGTVDVDAFLRAFEGMVLESDALRMVINEDDGIPQQQDLGRVPREMEYVDLSREGDVAGAYGEWLAEQTVRALDLKASVYDTALVKLGSERYVWYLNIHHILVDASSFVQIYQRVSERYKRIITGIEKAYVDWPQFREYLAHERRYQGSAQHQREERYWQNKIATGPEALRLWGKEPEKRSTRVKRESVRLGTERSEQLRRAARREGVYTISEDLSLYNIFGGMLFMELARMSGNRRLGLVTPVHNRFTEAFRNTVGLLLEFCPLQVEIGDEDTLEGVVKKVKKETRETMGYYQYGSGMALHSQAYDVMFNMYSVPRLELAGMEVEALRVHPGHGSESLGLHVTDVEGEMEFVLHFDFHEDVFEEAKREQVIEEYLRLLDDYLKDPEQSIFQFLQHDTDSTASIHLSGSNGREADKVVLERSGKHPYIAPRNDLESQLADVWEEVLGVTPVGIRDDFFDLGGSSWVALKLFARMQEAIGRVLPLTLFHQAGTIEQLVKEICKNETSQPWSPLVPIRTHGSKRPFYCVHGAGGHVFFIDALVRYLEHDRPVYAFQAQGIQAGQKPFTHVEEMAVFYLQALKAVQPHGPYLLSGYSMGGMIAFEMAQQLIAQGERVDKLVIIDTPAQNPLFRYLWNLTTWFASLVNMNQAERNEAFLSARNYFFRMRYFLRLNLIEKAAYIFDRGGAVGAKIARTLSKAIWGEELSVDSDIPQVEDIDVDCDLICQLFIVNETAFRLYIPRKYPGDVILFQSSDGYQDVDKDYSHIPNLGWNSVVEGNIDCFIVPGDHNEIIREPNVKVLGKQLRQVLEDAHRM